MKKNYTINFNVKLSTLFTIIIPLMVILGLGGIVGGIFIVDRVIMPRVITHDRGIIETPYICGLLFEDARERLHNVGLRIQVLRKEYNDSIPNNGVISQNPEHGVKVKYGRPVNVVLSKGPEVGIVPELRGLTESQMRIELRKSGFITPQIKRSYSEKYEKDKVVDVNPRPGTLCSRELPLEIVVSKGPKPTHVEVPSLIGESLAEAKQKIEDSNLSLGTISHQQSHSLKPGVVMSQSVPPGTYIPIGSSINIVVTISGSGR